MIVLVTGGTGFVGSHVMRALHRDGHQLCMFARSRERAEKQLVELAIDPGVVDIAVGDITDADSVRTALRGCDAVVHAAAVVGIEGSKALEAASTNERGARNVLGTAAEYGLDPIVYVSSFSALFRPNGSALLTPDTPVATGGRPYTASKAACERYARELQAQQLPVVCVYPGGVLGPDDPGLSEGLRAALIWRRVTMADIDSGFLLVDVRDIANIIAAALRPGRGPKRYLAGHHYIRWRDLGAMVAEVTGRPVHLPPISGGLLRLFGRGGDLARKVRPFSFPLSYEAMETASLMVPMDDGLTVQELGVTFRPPQETLRDSCRFLYETGRLDGRWVPALTG